MTITTSTATIPSLTPAWCRASSTAITVIRIRRTRSRFSWRTPLARRADWPTAAATAMATA